MKLKAKSLFSTKTFQGALLGLVGGLAPILIGCLYESRLPTKEESIAAAGLFSVFGWTLIGRVQSAPAYTPNYLPGPNAADFEAVKNGEH